MNNSVLAFQPVNLFSGIASEFQQCFVTDARYTYIISGLGNTLVITLFALMIGVVLGTLVALIKSAHQSNPKKLRVLNAIASLYVTVIRGTPVVVQLMIMYYIIVVGTPITDIGSAILAFGINSGAYLAEVIRSGIQSIDKGQTEAGRSLGLSQRTTMTKIVLPQALKNILPAIGNECISLLKETSVAGYIGVQDLTKGGDIIRSITYLPYTPLLTTAAIYLVIVICMSVLLTKLERRLHRSDNR